MLTLYRRREGSYHHFLSTEDWKLIPATIRALITEAKDEAVAVTKDDGNVTALRIVRSVS